ncbi:hypothetical protein QFZ79_002897 [Arthrobacter sp. V4I6]|uniref:phage major capsid protein n=1 Tax=Arthrobacter sp. V4I6 TaxID=3042281 RepID=UPI002786D445|nr:hypothetical protein [Arthrobacter sp. V4I6]MDQ0854786.1 hypothetical protein [Arthrobacter sp. V4I6]
MAATVSADLYSPEVWEDLAQAEFTGRSILLQATQTDDKLVGNPGDVVKFPKWLALGEMEDLAELVPMNTEKLTQSATEARIKEAGKAVEISDTAELVGIGNAQDEAIRQFGILAARKLDTDLYAAAIAVQTGGRTFADGRAAVDSSPLVFNAGTGVNIGWDALVDASAIFGDDWEASDFSGLYVNSAERARIMKDDDFIKAAQGAGDNSLQNRGLIGDINGVSVFVTNRVPAGKSLLLKRNALGLKFKRRPIVEQDRDILARATVVTTNMHFGAHRINDAGVLVINWNTAV